MTAKGKRLESQHLAEELDAEIMGIGKTAEEELEELRVAQPREVKLPSTNRVIKIGRSMKVRLNPDDIDLIANLVVERLKNGERIIKEV